MLVLMLARVLVLVRMWPVETTARVMPASVLSRYAVFQDIDHVTRLKSAESLPGDL